jgi:hypothetical protein
VKKGEMDVISDGNYGEIGLINLKELTLCYQLWNLVSREDQEDVVDKVI